ncbi:hypothetical protein EI77_03565 [Prosthecobacter fusiformis]|uniref:Uncharacterized protein n=1 Tax=Prosthecobacter fusiformis TaxID=48464 RepID=A0A4R7RM53_9BACT|nr:hypothetical protein [Prosthecobacter fusiformis]TDU66470.1 hypothetical protein EI77_03565 [Prosthecobacter fusiformis]
MNPFLVSLLFFVPAFTWAAEALSFQKMAAGETIYVTFSSQGCIHNHHYDFEFSKEDAVSVKVIHHPHLWNKELMREQALQPIDLGTLELKDKDLVKLDGLLAYYRHNTRGGCTTRDWIQIVQKNGGKIIATENYIDESCGTYDLTDALPLHMLINRLEKKRKKS